MDTEKPKGADEIAAGRRARYLARRGENPAPVEQNAGVQKAGESEPSTGDLGGDQTGRATEEPDETPLWLKGVKFPPAPDIPGSAPTPPFELPPLDMLPPPFNPIVDNSTQGEPAESSSRFIPPPPSPAPRIEAVFTGDVPGIPTPIPQSNTFGANPDQAAEARSSTSPQERTPISQNPRFARLERISRQDPFDRDDWENEMRLLASDRSEEAKAELAQYLDRLLSGEEERSEDPAHTETVEPFDPSAISETDDNSGSSMRDISTATTHVLEDPLVPKPLATTDPDAPKLSLLTDYDLPDWVGKDTNAAPAAVSESDDSWMTRMPNTPGYVDEADKQAVLRAREERQARQNQEPQPKHERPPAPTDSDEFDVFGDKPSPSSDDERRRRLAERRAAISPPPTSPPSENDTPSAPPAGTGSSPQPSETPGRPGGVGLPDFLRPDAPEPGRGIPPPPISVTGAESTSQPGELPATASIPPQPQRENELFEYPPGGTGPRIDRVLPFPEDETIRRIREREAYNAKDIMKYLTTHISPEDEGIQGQIFEALRERILTENEADTNVEGYALRDLRNLAEELVDSGYRLPVNVFDEDLRKGINGERLQSTAEVTADMAGYLDYLNDLEKTHNQKGWTQLLSKRKLRKQMDEIGDIYNDRVQRLVRQLDPTTFPVAMYVLLSPEKKRKMIRPADMNFLGMPHEYELHDLYKGDIGSMDIFSLAGEITNPSDQTRHETDLAFTAIYNRLQYLLITSPEQIRPYLSAIARGLKERGYTFDASTTGKDEYLDNALSQVTSHPGVLAQSLRLDTVAEGRMVRWASRITFNALLAYASDTTEARTPGRYDPSPQPNPHPEPAEPQPLDTFRDMYADIARQERIEKEIENIHSDRERTTRLNLAQISEQLYAYAQTPANLRRMGMFAYHALNEGFPGSQVTEFATDPDNGPYMMVRIPEEGTLGEARYLPFSPLPEYCKVTPEGNIENQDCFQWLILGRCIEESIRNAMSREDIEAIAPLARQFLEIQGANPILDGYVTPEIRELFLNP